MVNTSDTGFQTNGLSFRPAKRSKLSHFGVQLSLVCSTILLCSFAFADEPTIKIDNAILKTIQSADIAAQVSGILMEISVREGDRVTKGTSLARMQDEAVLLQVEKARLALETVKLKQQSNIDLQVATKSSAVAINELKRALEANQRVADTYPKTEVDRLQLIADRSKLEIERAVHARSLGAMDVQSAENELRIAEEIAKRHRILAPCDGTVVAVDKHPGEWVELGGRMLQIVSTEKLRIEGFVDVGIVDNAILGAEADVKVMGGSSVPRKAKVVFVGAEANPVNGKVRVFLDIDNPEAKLHPGQRVDAQIRSLQP